MKSNEEICQTLDAVECELRSLETRLYRLRMMFRERVPMAQRKECGFVDEQPLPASPKETP